MVVLILEGHLIYGYRFPLQISGTDICDSEGGQHILTPQSLGEQVPHLIYLIFRLSYVYRGQFEGIDVLWSM